MMDPCWRSPAQLRSFQIMTAGVGRGSLVRCHGGGGGSAADAGTCSKGVLIL